MSNIIIESINRDDFIEKISEIKNSNYKLLSIDGFIDSDENNNILYTFQNEIKAEAISVICDEEMPTITGIFKGAQFFEEELQEIMPVKFLGLQYGNRLILPEEFQIGSGQILIMDLDELNKLKNN